MNPLLTLIRERIGPVWSSVIGFIAALGYTTADLNEFALRIFYQANLDSGNVFVASVVAIIGYLVGKPEKQSEPAREVDRSPVKPVQRPDPQFEESAGVDPYKAPESVQRPPITVQSPKRDWFSDAEMDCKCQDLEGCDYQGMDETLLDMANDLRDRFGPLIVTSGYRCPAHNKAVGGVDDSYHVKGMAVDLKSPTVAPQALYDYLDAKYPRKFGIGCYKTFIHLDTRTKFWARKPSAKDVWKQYELDVVLA